MSKIALVALAIAGVLYPAIDTSAVGFADRVVTYTPGSVTDSRFTNNTSCVLGEPSRTNPWGEPVDPFNPPYGTNQIVMVGTGGSIVVAFDTPVINHPGNKHGVDFMIFGNAGFWMTNDFDPNTWLPIGSPATDGKLFSGQEPNSTRVSVSRDGVDFFMLDPTKAPVVDSFLPTDPTGDFHLPPPPAMTESNFAGANIDQIRSLYQGSAGGAGFDISWAQNSNGVPVFLPEVRFVRIDVLSGHSEIDALSAVYTKEAKVIFESFASNPAEKGWNKFGDANLFIWTTNQAVDVTWDSSKTNSYFHYPLGTVLSRSDDFSLSFDLTLHDVEAGVNTSKPFTFEVALGFQNFANATIPTFRRGTGRNLPNLAEFDYFPNTGYGATVWPCFWTTNGIANPDRNDTTIIELPIGVSMRVTMSYTASNSTTVTTITTNNVPIGAIKPVQLHSPEFTDFRLDTFAIESYSDAGAGGSILAHGTVDNVFITIPKPPVEHIQGRLVNGTWQVSFQGKANWRYALERSADLKSWSEVSSMDGNGESLTLEDPQPNQSNCQFYRVKSRRLD